MPASVNSCERDNQCAEGSCSAAGQCVASTTQLATVLVEVIPSAGTDGIAGVRFNQVITTADSLSLKLEHISRLLVQVNGGEVPIEACLTVPADSETAAGPSRSMYARTTLVPRQRLLGLPHPTHSAEASPDGSGEYRSSMAVPPGRYDLYVEPLMSDGECYRPPYLLLNQKIAAGDVSLTMTVPPPVPLSVVVRFPGMIDQLSGWSLDIIDRGTGRLLSNSVTLDSPEVIDGVLEYSAQLVYLAVAQSEPAAAGVQPSELLRLTPPEGTTAPQVYFERTVAELFQGGMGVIDQLQGLPKAVSYTGRVGRIGTADPAPSSVTLVARKLESMGAGVVTSFSRTAKTDDGGVFEVRLLPGEYLVQVQPTQEDLAQISTELTVSSGGEVQVGKVLEVPKRAGLSGRLRSFSGRSVAMTPLEVVPPPRARNLDVIDSARGEIQLLPGGQGGASDQEGLFSMLVDFGFYQIVARPEAGSGFPWGFRLGVEVSAEGTELDSLRLPLPYVIDGGLTSSDVGDLPSALIRAYAFLRDGELTNQPELATSVVAVGEARVDEESRFRLLLPAQLD